MAINFDAGSVGFTGYGGTTTFSHTIGSGDNRILIVGVTIANSGEKVASVTYNGVAMTRQRAELGGASISTYVYSLISPPTGTANVVVTYTSSDISSVVLGSSYTGVDQTAPFLDKKGVANGFATSPMAVAITNAADGMAVSFVGTGGTSVDTSVLFSPVSATLINQSDNSEVDAGNMLGAMSYSTGASSMSWSWSGPQKLVSQTVVSLKSASSGGGADTTSPVMTGSLSPSSITSSGFTVSWSAATDNVAVTGYQTRINNGSWVDNATATTKVFSGLASSTAYTVDVRAYDAAGNYSSPISTSVTTNSSGVSATLTTGVFKNNTGTVLSNLTGLNVAILTLPSLAFVYGFSGKTTDSSGVVTINDTHIVAGTQYAVVVSDSSGTLGVEKYTAV